MKKVLFADTVHPYLEEELLKLGYQCDHFTSKDIEEFKQLLPNYFGLVIRSKFKMTVDLLDLGTQLKFICRSGAGMENIDVPYAESKGIACINSPEGNKDAVGEQAIGMLLMLFNNLKRADAEVRQGIWDREGNRGIELAGLTVGILGFGNMGSAMAEKLQGFNVRIVAYDKYKTNYAPKYVEELSEAEFFMVTDVLSLHLPETPETRYLVDENYINRFAKNIFIINTARGKNLKTAALVDALESSKVRGACLDVLEYEAVSFENLFGDGSSEMPAPLAYLLQSDKVILSPHIAGWTVESYYKLSFYLAEKVKRLFH